MFVGYPTIAIGSTCFTRFSQFTASKCQAVLPQEALLVRHCSRLHCRPQRGRILGETRLLWTLFHQGPTGSSKQGLAGIPPWDVQQLRGLIQSSG